MRATATTTIALTLALATATAHADVLIVTEQGNTPMPRQETQISMDAETVRIRPGEAGHYQATCTFKMRSHAGAPLKRKMAFPVVDTRYGHFMKEYFKVELGPARGGELRRVPVQLKMKRTRSSWAEEFYFKPPHDSFDYPGFVVWDVSWAPGETKTVRVSYDMGQARRYGGIVDGWGLLYVVRTGALWKGPIGRAEITIDFRRDVRSHRTSATPLWISHRRQARWLSPRKVRWRFVNWEPRRDIEVKSLAWVGLSERVRKSYFLALPHPYRGAKARYDRKLLDALVEEELKPWRAHFPRRCARVDREALRGIVAAWLYHEILARRGDPFLVGKVGPGGKWPPGAVMSTEGYAYGEWSSRFRAYMYHGGWYRPRYGPQGKVQAKDLAPLERANLAFLKRFM